MIGAQKEPFEKAIVEICDLHGNMSVLSQLDAILKDENADLTDVEKLIQSDGALSASIVKLSNKGMFGFGSKSEDLYQALQTVGFQGALKLVSMALSKQVFMRDLDAYGISANSYWKYSYFTAGFMEKQARRSGISESEAYLLGLLHSIGRVVVNELLHVHEIEVFWDRFVPVDQWEIETIGFTSERAGSLLLNNWKFPEKFCDFVENQFNPEAQQANPILQLLDFARTVSANIDDSNFIDELCSNKSHAYLDLNDQPITDIQNDIIETQAQVDDVHQSLG